MIVLSDNDVLFKLAQCDLFAEFLAAFGVDAAGVQILRTTRFAVLSKGHRKRIGAESFARLAAFLETIGDIAAEPDPAAVAALTEQTDKNIDAGEAALFAVCPVIETSVVVTGDKRSLAGLTAAAAADGVCADLYARLAGRVFCFEQVLLRILDHAGYEAVRDNLIRGRECDRVLTITLGSGLDAREDALRRGLASYLNAARAASGELLAP